MAVRGNGIKLSEVQRVVDFDWFDDVIDLMD
jgi:hypothetical protein